jgi:hypothetical protein
MAARRRDRRRIAIERELRAAWASGRRIVVTFDAVPQGRLRARGRVWHVAPTGQFATVGRTHVLLHAVREIQDAPTVKGGPTAPATPGPIPGQLPLQPSGCTK